MERREAALPSAASSWISPEQLKESLLQIDASARVDWTGSALRIEAQGRQIELYPNPPRLVIDGIKEASREPIIGWRSGRFQGEKEIFVAPNAVSRIMELLSASESKSQNETPASAYEQPESEARHPLKPTSSHAFAPAKAATTAVWNHKYLLYAALAGAGACVLCLGMLVFGGPLRLAIAAWSFGGLVMGVLLRLPPLARLRRAMQNAWWGWRQKRLIRARLHEQRRQTANLSSEFNGQLASADINEMAVKAFMAANHNQQPDPEQLWREVMRIYHDQEQAILLDSRLSADDKQKHIERLKQSIDEIFAKPPSRRPE